MSQALRKIAGAVNKSNTCVIFINQLREKIGIMFGNPETTTGGRALKFYASMRLDVRKIDTIKKGEEVYGNRTRVKIVKNKVAPPFKKAEFDIMYGTGISLSGDILDMAVDQNIIDKAGSWYSYNNERIGQGRENVKAYLEDRPDVLDEIRNKLLGKIKADADAGIQVDEDGVVIE
jgi:recombination protein RecA